MKIQFLTTAHNSLSQRLEIELAERGHEIIITRAVSDEVMIADVALHQPQLISRRCSRSPSPRRSA